MGKKIPIRIETDQIMDPQARWICQRLDALNTVMTRFIEEVLPEIREMNEMLKAIKDIKDTEPNPADG